MCATNLGLCVKIIRRTESSKFTIVSDSYASQAFELDVSRAADDFSSAAACTSLKPASPPAIWAWAHYPNVVLTRLYKLFSLSAFGAEACDLVKVNGFDMAIASDLPQASGLSSSSALVIATFLAFYFANDLHENELFTSQIQSREDLCQFLGCLENGCEFKNFAAGHGVGTHGGSQDHVAIFASAENQIHVNSYAPVRFLRSVAFPSSWCFVVAVSGVLAEKTSGSKEQFNNLVAVGKRGKHVIEGLVYKTYASLGEAFENEKVVKHVCADGFDAAVVSEGDTASTEKDDWVTRSFNRKTEARRRLVQFYKETHQYVDGICDAIETSDVDAVNEFSAASMRLATDVLQNQIEETIALVNIANGLGAHGASAFGAGFGGAVWAIVDSAQAETFATQWLDEYLRKETCDFSARQRASVHVLRPGPGVCWVQP